MYCYLDGGRSAWAAFGCSTFRVGYELKEIEFKQREIEYEKRMMQLKSEIERLDALNSKIHPLVFNSNTSSNTLGWLELNEGEVLLRRLLHCV